MNKIKKLLGQRIKEIRKSRGLTQEELAEKIGIGTPNISYFETGKFAPSIENFEKIVNALQVEPYEFYNFNHIKTTTEMRNELYEALSTNDNLVKQIYKIYQAIK